MRQSQFNIINKINNEEIIIYNSYSGALAKLNKRYINIIDNIKNIEYKQYKDEIDSMKKCGFIVDKEVDELKKIKDLIEKNKTISNKLKLVIAPTLECNFRCLYCYENQIEGKMNISIQNNIVKLCEYMIYTKKINEIQLFWYGGEPLLYNDIINNLSQKIIDLCKKNDVKYIAGIVTNGYLINKKMIDEFKKNRILSAQITLDGTKDVHDKRRVLYDGKNGTFIKIFKNINLLLNENINVTIRMNVDKENKDNIKDLVEFLKDNIDDKRKVNLSLGCVFPTDEDKNNRNIYCMNKSEFADVKLDTLMIAQKYNLNKIIDKNFPKKRFNYCSAPTESSYVINHKGEVFKCWNDVCDENLKVGYIEDIIQDNIKDNCIFKK